MTEPEVTTLSEKGQVVIPQTLRNKLGLKPKTKLLVYGYRDTVIMKRLELPDINDELEALWKEIDQGRAGKRRPTEEEILEEIRRYRKEKK
jgi:AbrB family looped-hinge helix DNA binding protein